MKNTNNYYFDELDFNTFEESKVTLNTKDIRDARKRVKGKLLDLNDELLQVLRQAKLDLHNHSNPNNITSLIQPCEYNHGKVNWLGIRYGRSASAIAELNFGLGKDEKDEKLGFQKYSCMQVNICYDGVEVGLYHAVPADSVDRWNLHEHIDDTELQTKLINEIRNLQGYGYKWIVSDKIGNRYEFDFDNRKAEEFISFYKEYDKDGCYSSMLMHFPRWDERIQSSNLVMTCYKIIEQLYNLYQLIIWKKKEGTN